MNNSNEKQVIKLSQLGQLNEVEAYVRQFSNLVKDLLMTMMVYSNKPISVEGTKQQVQSFVRVL